MPAFARVVIPGVLHHVTQRGNYRQDIFHTPQDRITYLQHVTTAAVEYGLEIHGWCLMTNHVHWIVLPHVQTAMADTFRRAHSRFSAFMNRQHKRANGHLWQGRYYSCPLDGSHFGVNSTESALDEQLDLTAHFNTGFVRHTFATGVEAERETSDPTRPTFTAPTTSLLNPNPDQLLNPNPAIASRVNDSAISVGAYAIDTMGLGQKLDLTGGIRYDRFR